MVGKCVEDLEIQCTAVQLSTRVKLATLYSLFLILNFNLLFHQREQLEQKKLKMERKVSGNNPLFIIIITNY